MKPSLPIALLALLVAGPAAAQTVKAVPDELQGVGVTEHLGRRLPADLELVDENGRRVVLGDYFDGRRPVILSLGYFRCPMLCNLIWNSLVDTLRELEWTAGQEFTILTVSIDPDETAALAAAKKENYIRSYQRPSAAAGWHFLTAEQPVITELATQVGFDYRYLREQDEFAHTAVLFMLSPEGKIVRYLYGVSQEPKTLRLALVEASEGTIGTTLDRVILYCFHYDAKERRYTPAAMALMRVMGAITIAALGSVLLVLWRVDRRRKKKMAATEAR
ncbi:MAG: SCO family protein [Acidobacteriota bacterium]|nr:SCO family protein [Acidobacteriota bacterium]MDQ7087955.1 SCO family protein [Acidobacteriota bacterium]